MTSPYTDLNRPPLNAAVLRRALCAPRGPISRLDIVESTGSTNVDAADGLAAEPGAWPDLSVVVAEHQSAGTGRRGRQWSSPARSGIYSSIVLRPNLDAVNPWPAGSFGWLPLLGGLAACEAIADVGELATSVKWPNDVLVETADGDRKVAGVLARAVLLGQEQAVVLGAGINVTLNREELPHPAATSVQLAGAVVYDRDSLLRAYLRRVVHWYSALKGSGGDAEASGLAGAVRGRTSTLGAEVRVELPGERSLTGAAARIDSQARLVVRHGSQETSVSAGDVVHVRRAGAASPAPEEETAGRARTEDEES
ncbi:biotin--[acetyl-CoA-carboxylase] ligase [Saxibacter everestensis]|uniref:Biotin--[acetyl-CoA-carboxylase] ligase n=1 Tax=Saxibacter everestensis TaxID=2909229 RepID=A0ABY8QP49_9MICO|nr:biotin--[acetyl-CoA-carboxylase] ligase [Brevibacteriaceae bacterium ZFBP1038]